MGGIGVLTLPLLRFCFLLSPAPAVVVYGSLAAVSLAQWSLSVSCLVLLCVTMLHNLDAVCIRVWGMGVQRGLVRMSIGESIFGEMFKFSLGGFVWGPTFCKLTLEVGMSAGLGSMAVILPASLRLVGRWSGGPVT